MLILCILPVGMVSFVQMSTRCRCICKFTHCPCSKSNSSSNVFFTLYQVQFTLSVWFIWMRMTISFILRNYLSSVYCAYVHSVYTGNKRKEKLKWMFLLISNFQLCSSLPYSLFSHHNGWAINGANCIMYVCKVLWKLRSIKQVSSALKD